MGERTYTEHFDNGPGGWFGWKSNSEGPKPLEYQPGVVTFPQSLVD